MASSIVSGGSSASNNQRGYSVEPSDVIIRNKPPVSNYVVNDFDEKVNFSCQNGTLFLKISSALLIVSSIIQIIAVGAPYWAAGWRRDKMSWHEGVWMTCYRPEMDNKWICGAYDYSNEMPGVPSWYTACQAMGLCSIVIFLPAILLNMFYTMHPKGRSYSGLMVFNIFFTFFTGLLPLLMIIVFAAGHPRRDRFPIPYLDEDYDDSPFEFHFSFVFEIFAVLISFGSFGLQVADYLKNWENYDK